MTIMTLQPQPELSLWTGCDEIQCAEASTSTVVVGLGVEAAEPDGWYWEIVNVADDVIASGFVDTISAATTVAIAAATRHLAERHHDGGR
ncbi:hypothetical protein [Rhodopseudomonas palustris]|uniref:hypothetical protein n=1 Tax=Rhodopseudomonas palustris TaxID=1076 RepID=UPI0012EE564E|nr:hypothetical protein [Rhodopseudomonas palustris]